MEQCWNNKAYKKEYKNENTIYRENMEITLDLFMAYRF